MISENLKKRIYTSFLLILLLFLMLLLKPILLYFLIIIGIFSIIEFSELIKAINKKFIPKLFYNLIFILFIFIFCLLFFILSNIIQFKIILFSLLLTCVASDVGGYTFGKTFKGPKITKISPNKTFSGSIGSVILSCITFCSLLFLMTKNINFVILLTGIVTSLFCQLGDLYFSLLKRKAKKKDTGNLLPGHGGILDRVDGIIFGLPAGFIFLLIFLR
jgi:phosphatidate cytidylyltransferase